jgi:uncharacterized membrane protein HdeD (DUF308 family)
VLSFFASFVIPSRGLSGLAVAVVGIAVVVFAMTRRRWHMSARILASVVGLAIFAVLPQRVPPVRTVGTAFFPEDDRAEFIMAIETPP